MQTVMAAAATQAAAVDPEWFAAWFDSAHYHRLYQHRDEREAAALVDRLVEHLRPAPGARALDLGCGAGRHARQLAARGLDVTGLDLSAESIAQARGSELGEGSDGSEGSDGGNLRFVRQDMRLPFGSDQFDYVFSLFTSFGYFEQPAEHVTVLHHIATSLKAGGVLVLDYLNVHYADSHLTRGDESITRDGIVYRVSRWSDDDAFFKRIAVDGAAYTERVAKLSLEELRFMLALCGMAIESLHGDYALQPFDRERSPRLMLIARKSSTNLTPRQVLADAADRFRRHAEI
jgi:SAM-dependent methyltransferase